MAQGLRVINADGFVHVDESHRRVGIIKDGTARFNEYINAYSIHITGNGYGVGFASTPYGEWIDYGLTSSPCRYVVVDSTESTPPNHAVGYGFQFHRWNGSDHGLKVFNASNKIVYDSSVKTLVIDFVAVWNMSTTETTFTLPTPRLGQRFIQIAARPNIAWRGGYWKRLQTRLNSETSLSVRLLSGYTPGTAGGPSYDYEGKSIVICAGYAI